MRVRIEQGPNPYGGHHHRIFVDDKELEEVTDIQVAIPLDDVPRVQVELNIGPGFEFTAADARVNVHAVVLPGYQLIEEARPDGVKVYWCAEWQK